MLSATLNATILLFAVFIGGCGIGMKHPLSEASSLDSIAPLAGSNPTVSSVSSRSLTLSWGSASDNTTPAESLLYKVVRASSESTIDSIEKIEQGLGISVLSWTSFSNNPSVSVSDLSPSTSYSFAVLVKDVAGNKVLYPFISQTTSGSGSLLQYWTGTKQLGVDGAGTVGNGVVTDSSGNIFIAGETNGGLDGNTLTGTIDFFVTKYDSSGTRQWTKQLGVAAKDTRGIGVATDSSGNIFVAGYTNGGLDGNALTGTVDFFVTKYDSSGTRQWTKQLGVAAKLTYGIGVATDSSGNIFVAGYTTGGLDGNALTGTTDFFVTKYDSSGTRQWTKQLGVATENTYGNGVATDTSGNIFITGHTYGGLDGNTLTGTSDFFVTKYNSSGTRQWTKQLGVAAKETYAIGVATDTSGNIFVTGRTYGGLDGNALTGTTDFFVTKYDSSGTRQWTKQLGVAAKDTRGIGVAIDSSGNIFVAGYTNGGLDGNALTGTVDFFVTKYDSSGTRQWTKQLGVATKNTYGAGGATDSSGNIFVAGYTTGGLDGNALTGTTDFFVTKYDSSGTKQ